MLDSRQGYRTKFRQLKAKKRALVHLEREDAVKHGGVKDDDLAIEDEYEPDRKVFCAEQQQQPPQQSTSIQATNHGAEEPAAAPEPAPPTGSSTALFGVNMSFWANVNDVSYIQVTFDELRF